ncbi:MAG: hypothetical protein C3F14_04845 [Deltaproteobacteria bacterium]|nr:MAG: hypothetical protein C3F14_04845 [Deltaproteobacteria bacterium]
MVHIPSARAAGVRLPIIPTDAGWIAQTPGTISLGQGVAYYGPPPDAMRFLASPEVTIIDIERPPDRL